MTNMAPRNDGSSLLSEQHGINTDANSIATDDLLGLDAPAPSPPQDNDPFAIEKKISNDDDIMSLASELTEGAMKLEAIKSMKLNDAFLSLDKMRQANLEVEFGHTINHKKCVQCIRKLPPNKRPSTPSPYRLLKSKKCKPCLLCGNPSCSNHLDKSFSKSKVIICNECSPLFSLDFIVDCVSHKNNTDDPKAAQKQRHQIKHMIDVYDRVLIMLEYSAQYIDEIAAKLEKTTKKEDKIGLSCNASGVVSGMAGVAAAACFVTPAGPPLLIASLLFSGASQITSSGNKMVNYYSTPNKIAFKIISLYNLCKSVLTVTTVLRDALLKDHIDLEKYVENMIKETELAALEMKTGFEDDESDETKVTEDDDETTVLGDDIDFNDDDSWSTFKSATPSKSGGVAFSENTESPLAKIDESKEFDKNESHVATISPRFEGLFLSKDNNKDGSSSGSRTLEGIDEPKGNVVANPMTSTTDSAITTLALPDSSARSPKKLLQKDCKTQSPSKKEQIEEMKKTNHFMEREDKVGSLARFYSRSSLAGSSLVSAAAVTVFAGAALSAVHLGFEANNLAATIKRIQAGSPSKRAQALRVIKEDVRNLPRTNIIVQEWDKYLEVLFERQISKADSR